jgi:hypothetical protein
MAPTASPPSKPAATSPPPAVAGVVMRPEKTVTAARLTARLCLHDIRTFGFMGRNLQSFDPGVKT